MEKILAYPKLFSRYYILIRKSNTEKEDKIYLVFFAPKIGNGREQHQHLPPTKQKYFTNER